MSLSFQKFSVLFFLISTLTLLSFFIFSTKASAQEQLQPTQVVANIPEQYNEVFQLQWGGGSLYQLKQRLATMSCIVDTIWVYNNNQWNPYNQYQVPSTLNTHFQNTYSQFIPAGTLYASCFDICELQYHNIQSRECKSFESLRRVNFYNVLPDPISSTTFCTNNFNPLIVQQVFPILPLHPDTCIVRQESRWPIAYAHHFFLRYTDITTHPNSTPFIVLYAPNDFVSPNDSPEVQQMRGTRLLQSEIHELCHINQYWYIAQALQPDNPSTTPTNDIWYQTPAGREFIALTGFTNTNGVWTLPADNVWKDVYGTHTPFELSAELCALYATEKIGVESIYGPNVYNIYLTPEIRQWLETYMVLPAITS